MLSRTLLLTGLVAISAPAYGYDEAKQAEYQRLSQQMTNLAQRNQWQGVDRVYREMIEAKLHDNMEAEDHLLGADAARTLGDVGGQQARYEEALIVLPNIEITQKLAAIQREYGKVVLLARPGGIKIVPDERPFNPDLAAAIDFAQAKLQEHGRFDGVLPLGGYTLAGTHFDVKLLQPVDTINVRKAGEGDTISDAGDGGAGGDVQGEGSGEKEKKGGGAKIAMLAGAGAAAIAAGTMFGLAKSKEAYYYGDDIQHSELEGVASQANSLATISVIAGGAALGFGVGAVLVVDW